MNEVSLLDMMNARELRASIQQRLLDQYKFPLICFTMNIPGPVKVFDLVPEAFAMGKEKIETLLHDWGFSVLALETLEEKTGYEAFYIVHAPAEDLKRQMVLIEDQDGLGRLFDIDVLDEKGTKLSREDLGLSPRRCLLCEEQAQVCSRSRSHSVEQLTARIRTLLQEGITS